MALLGFLAAVAGSPALAEGAVEETHRCLAEPFTTEVAFTDCLAPAQAAAEAAVGDVEALGELTQGLSERQMELQSRLRSGMPEADFAAMQDGLYSGLYEQHEACTNRMGAEGLSYELTVARCDLEAEFWTLLDLFQNWLDAWEGVK